MEGGWTQEKKNQKNKGGKTLGVGKKGGGTQNFSGKLDHTKKKRVVKEERVAKERSGNTGKDHKTRN